MAGVDHWHFGKGLALVPNRSKHVSLGIDLSATGAMLCLLVRDIHIDEIEHLTDFHSHNMRVIEQTPGA